MTKLRFLEQGRIVESEKDSGRYLVRIIAEGQGSSAFYSREMLEENAAAFSESLSFQNHPNDPEAPWERDLTQIVGHIDGDTWFQEGDDGVAGIYGNYVVDPDFKEKFDRYARKIGLSIYISGQYEECDDEETGRRFEARSFDGTDPYKSVDVVIAPGAGGRVENFQEALRRLAENNAGDDPVDRKDDNMDIEDVKLVVNEALEAHLDKLAESQAEAEAAEVDTESAIATAVEAYAASLKAISDADLLPAQVTQLEEHARKGEDVSKLIEDAKAVAADAASVGAAAGRRFGEANQPDSDKYEASTAFQNWGK